MNTIVPRCRTIHVISLRGDRSRQFLTSFRQTLHLEKNGLGIGPTNLDCLSYLGHAGISTDGGKTFYGFSPSGAGVPVWQLLDGLKNGTAYPGIVRDDTGVFALARQRGRAFMSLEIILPDPHFQNFQSDLDAERQTSQYSYGFPNGDGDCNCVTWIERIGLPLLSGRMSEFARLPGNVSMPYRRFGRCV